MEFIRLQFTDLFGNLKNIAVTASQLDRVLSNKCMFDGSAIDGFARIEESDMYLYPDLSTLEIFPWRPQQGKVARMICDVYRPNGQPFEGDPRYVLKRAVQQAEDMGYTFEVGPECEFFLFNTDENTMPTTNTHEQAGYFDIGPLDFGENARRDIVMNLEDMGFVIEASHHEMAPAQHEIDFRYDEALNTADNIMTSRWPYAPLRDVMDCTLLLCRSPSSVSTVPACTSTCPCRRMEKTFSRMLPIPMV